MITEQTKMGAILKNESARACLVRAFPFLDEEKHLLFIYKTMKLGEFLDSRVRLGFAMEQRAVLADELRGLPEIAEPGAGGSADGHPLQYTAADAEGRVLLSPEFAPQWEVFELQLEGPSAGNPYIEVELGAVFSRAGEDRTVKVDGFYEGNGYYRVRFMPDSEGEWHYRTFSSVSGLSSHEGDFFCTAPLAGVHGPVRVSNTFHFSYADGTPYLPVGTTCYVWTHQEESVEEATLESLKDSPFNKIRMCVFPKSYLYNRNEPQRYPFAGSLESGWDFEVFNPDFFEHLERRIAGLGRLGIEADLILMHPYDKWGFSEMDRAADERYLRYIIARLGAFRNVWWSLANEYDLMWAKTDEDWEYFGTLVQANDPYPHLLSNHNCLAFYDHDKPWISHCSLQRVDVYKTSEATTEWRQRWNKPVVIDECAYEGDIDQGWGNITGEEMTRRFWEGFVRGGYVGHGETYMNSEELLWWSKGGELTGTSPARIAFLRKMIEESPAGYWEPLPSDWDLPCAGIDQEYYIYYFGFNQPRFRNFHFKPGVQYAVEIIDTWNMTISKELELKEGSFRVDLPARQYMAVRFTRQLP
ncbi:DUF5605 domain-containing protein [Paenibacillus sp. MMS20-IR301]|uniref:DUF5605 domain-containing protein n=1 Tax=Paenibacillus sp. MMS20-IR301 TaxID=2895946 RepID=UPI0028E58F25|nr:DUF5605 domain-containing protein [Paenibacillus sp. MMS20-IR301]WNS42885.1 DUF5605 domain-containing protein [Paenibacillus sp. MMS20-IR301]